MNVVCKVSVQTIVLIPPLCVYIQIKRIEKITVNSNGIWNESKTNFWSTIATKKSLKEAPIILDMKKKKGGIVELRPTREEDRERGTKLMYDMMDLFAGQARASS